MKETKAEKNEKAEKGISLKTLTKSSVWDLQENDVFRLLEGAEKDAVNALIEEMTQKLNELVQATEDVK